MTIQIAMVINPENWNFSDYYQPLDKTLSLKSCLNLSRSAFNDENNTILKFF